MEPLELIRERIKDCLILAEKSLPYDVPVGALVLNSSGEIIGQGYNKREKTKKISDHAEIIAINEASEKLKDWRLIGCSLFVTLEPCLMCAGAIIQSRIKTIYFGAYDPKENTSYLLEKKNIKCYGGFYEEKCSEILKNFFTDSSRKKRP